MICNFAVLSPSKIAITVKITQTFVSEKYPILKKVNQLSILKKLNMSSAQKCGNNNLFDLKLSEKMQVLSTLQSKYGTNFRNFMIRL